MKILVTGACGQLGMSLRAVLPAGTVFTDVVEAPETTYLDITDRQAIKRLVSAEKVDCIINCAAYTNVEAAEDNYDLAELLNAKAVENLAAVMKEADGMLVHISTDYVFGLEPYNTPAGRTKKARPQAFTDSPSFTEKRRYFQAAYVTSLSVHLGYTANMARTS